MADLDICLVVDTPFVVILVCAITAATVKDGKYSRFAHIRDDEGVLRRVDLEAAPNTDFIKHVARNPANNAYYLYTRQNPTSPQELTFNAASITSSNFNANAPTVVSVHGWWGNADTSNNVVIRNAFLEKGDYNVIVMDWSQLAAQDYVTAVAGIPAVGGGLGQFLNFLGLTTGIAFESIHLAGFSLGAHVVGNAGKQLNGRLARITGLDPAGPLWDLNPNRLHSSDAIYVEAIHTDASPNGVGIGFMVTVGHVDFFPNGGLAQPGCTTSQCHHNRAWEMFAASVTYDHLTGRQCSSISQVLNDNCVGQSLNMGNADLQKRG
ncbi:pancreatic lipase-related protein 2 [Bicyclus anynana]|uniref:Pancreatic lipase-related protein 2 n=1 Tax=Bicyclus anynana TaxID=110368 RepID=A0ABM3LID5_BICAN|nr:pancreatic lipase-related protein 2 [Bicyclus anynana]